MPDRSSPPSPAAPSVTFHEPGIVRLPLRPPPARERAPRTRWWPRRARTWRSASSAAPASRSTTPASCAWRSPRGPCARSTGAGRCSWRKARAWASSRTPSGRRGVRRRDRRGRALLRLRREDRAARQARPLDDHLEHRRVSTPRSRGYPPDAGSALPVDPVLRRPARRRRPTGSSSTTPTDCAFDMGASEPDVYRDRRRTAAWSTSTSSPARGSPTCCGATPRSPAACRCRRAGRSATTSRAGATRPTQEVLAVAASFARAASPPTGSGSTSSTWTASARFTWDPVDFPDPRELLARRSASSASRRSSSSIPAIKVDPAWDVYAEALRDGHLLSRGDGALRGRGLARARRSSPTSPARRRAPGGARWSRAPSTPACAACGST